MKTFIQQLDAARTAQQQAQTLDKFLRQALEASRLDLAKQMHKVFGLLLYKHYDLPTDISRYYEMKYLQNPRKSSSAPSFSKYTLSANSRITLFSGQLSANSYLTLRTKSQYAVKVFSSSDTNAAIPIDALQLNASQTENLYANELSDGNGFNWLILVNETGADIEVEVAKTEVEQG